MWDQILQEIPWKVEWGVFRASIHAGPVGGGRRGKACRKRATLGLPGRSCLTALAQQLLQIRDGEKPGLLQVQGWVHRSRWG